MNICIVGWYGTETLGDRAILDGILAIFNKIYGEFRVNLGSLYPFLSERTIYEDKDIHQLTAPKCSIKIFDEKSNELIDNIKRSEIVLMGGGPIMNLEELYIIRKAFKIGKQYRKKTILLGCGIGPLTNPKFINVVKKIIELSDLIILRDEISCEICKNIYGNINTYHVVSDPAIISVLNYKKSASKKDENYIAINFREFPSEYGKNQGMMFNSIKELLYQSLCQYGEVKLIPMHTFFIGGDDREFFCEICDEDKLKGITINFKPQNIYELYSTYTSAKACIGMRYHSVVLQTILNGNNYILDYTEPNKGKISGFISSLEKSEFYINRYYNLQDNKKFNITKCLSILSKEDSYMYIKPSDLVEDYCKLISELF